MLAAGHHDGAVSIWRTAGLRQDISMDIVGPGFGRADGWGGGYQELDLAYLQEALRSGRIVAVSSSMTSPFACSTPPIGASTSSLLSGFLEELASDPDGGGNSQLAQVVQDCDQSIAATEPDDYQSANT